MSCVKTNETTFTNTYVEKPYASTITDISCGLNKSNDEHFEATINGKSLCLSSDYKHTVWNNNWVLWKNEIWMLKKDPDSTIGICIKYIRPQFHNYTLPYTVNKATAKQCEVIDIIIMNYKGKYCGCTADDSKYESQTSTQNLSVTITSFKDSVIEGTYSGDFYNSGGKMFSVTNGYFKTKVKAQN